MNREMVLVGGVILVSLVLGKLFWFLPALVILSGVLARVVDNSGWYLMLVAVVAELVSVLPVGIVAAIVMVPWVAHYLVRKVSVDVSFSYLLLVGLVVIVQMLILFLPDSLVVSPVEAVTAIPWFRVMITIALASLFVYGASVIIHFNWTWQR